MASRQVAPRGPSGLLSTFVAVGAAAVLPLALGLVEITAPVLAVSAWALGIVVVATLWFVAYVLWFLTSTRRLEEVELKQVSRASGVTSATIRRAGATSAWFATGYAYQPGSLRVNVDGVNIEAGLTELDALHGTFEIDFALESDETMAAHWDVPTD